jgi:hypothetical protein
MHAYSQFLFHRYGGQDSRILRLKIQIIAALSSIPAKSRHSLPQPLTEDAARWIGDVFLKKITHFQTIPSPAGFAALTWLKNEYVCGNSGR